MSELAHLVAIVPVHDGGEDVGRSIGALVASGLPPSDILVVDDASDDGAAAAAADAFGTRYARLEGGPGGPARARNRGAALADVADVLLFVDADVLVHPDTVSRIASLMDREPDLSAAFGSYDDSPPAEGWISQYKNLLHHRMHQEGSPEACTFWSGCGAVRREVFLAMGGFDESFGNASIEDVDFGLRLHDAGRRIRLERDVQCTHLKRWTLSSWLRTDIFQRALPWSRLLFERGQGIPSSLNLGYRERASAALALIATLALLALAFAPATATFALLVSLGGFVALQRRLLAFFACRRGPAFAIAAGAMHLCYFVYSSIVFAGVRLTMPFSRSPRPRFL